MDALLRRCGLIGMFLLAVPAASFAQAQPQEDLGTQRARALFEAGRAAFEASDYEAALRNFRESYELSHRAALLYNIGICADRLRHDQEALESFEQFLAQSPADAPQRHDVEVRVAAIRAQLASGGGSTLPGGGDESLALAGWGLLIGGAVVLATGVVFLGIGQNDASTVENAPEGTPWIDVADAAARADWMRVAGWVLGGVGLALAGVGLTLALIAPSSTESASLHIGPGALAFVWRHR
jgi:tetratricopeptide (TPR) repeat protein